MSEILTADQLLAAKAYKTQTLEAFGGKVVVRTLPMGGRIALRTHAMVAPGKLDDMKFAAVTLQFGLESPRLTMEQAEKLLAEQPAEVVEPVIAAIWKLSGMEEAAAKNG
jgi:hypothetical protein